MSFIDTTQLAVLKRTRHRSDLSDQRFISLFYCIVSKLFKPFLSNPLTLTFLSISSTSLLHYKH